MLAAYEEGEAWLDAVKDYVLKNIQILENELPLRTRGKIKVNLHVHVHVIRVRFRVRIRI